MSKNENDVRRSSRRMKTSWRIINPSGVVPVAKPMSMVQTTPIVIKIVNTTENTAKKQDIEDDYSY